MKKETENWITALIFGILIAIAEILLILWAVEVLDERKN
jgi:hypothetical protein